MRRLLLAGFVLLPILAIAQLQLFRKMRDPSLPTFAASFKKSVVQIELHCKHGETLVDYGATGFFVGYPDPAGKDSFLPYLVTNRHVAECWDEASHPQVVLSAKVRLNGTDGTAKEYPLDPTTWHFSPDDSVDLAVMAMHLPAGLEMTYTPVSDFATKDYLTKNGIAEGSPVILSGYFYQFPGERKFEPIIRQGILSMIPDEPMMTTAGKLGSIYLADAHIFGGNSGSPILVAEDALNIDGYRLLGVVSGYYFENSDFTLVISTISKGTMRANSGVAMIVPVDFVQAILDDPYFKVARDAYFQKFNSIKDPKAASSTGK